MFEIPQQVMHETVGGETMIVRLDSGNYYSLNSTGGLIWTFIEQGASRSQIITEYAELYSLDKKIAEEQIELFLKDIIKEGLILPTDISPDACSKHKFNSISCCTDSFEPPLLSKYSDMQELLILDPIHDVSEAGWPNPKTDNGDNG